MRALALAIIMCGVLAAGATNNCSAQHCSDPCACGEVCGCGDCCDCSHCGVKLKKFYRPVVSFKEVCYTKYNYCIECQDVPAPTTTCAPCDGSCGCGDTCGCGESCGCGSACGDGCGCGCGCGESLQPQGLGAKLCAFFGKPRTIRVPVAVQTTGPKCVRRVPVVTWCVEYRCVKCGHEEKELSPCLEFLAHGHEGCEDECE